MSRTLVKKISVFVALLLTSLLLLQVVWQMAASTPAGRSAEKINLALRRTVHQLLQEAGDRRTEIPPVEQPAPGVWQLRLPQPFDYDRLPALLQAALDAHGIREKYDVAVLRCTDLVLLLGYSSVDLEENQSIPCGGRDMDPGCYTLQVSFPAWADTPARPPAPAWLLLLATALATGFYALGRVRASRSAAEPASPPAETEWLHFGQSRLDVANQLLLCGAVSHTLTYRESKLLQLFASRPNQLLERSFILEHVWADEGVLVGRSVDVFVSRLRKMLRDDPSLSLVAVHGVGYRLEEGNVKCKM
ncbi:MAG: response regulator transcription factor [Saprospiraceae bacterium]|nr:response regulator transcription factor [Saprospiraceae bacterium]